MSLTKKEKILFLRISDGKLRVKTSKEDPEAQERYVEINNSYIYERVYSTCTGYLREIRLQEHEEYGTSYSMIIFDPKSQETYSLQMSDNSRYFAALVQHLPNFDFSKPITVKPFSFKQDGRTNIGLTFEQDGEKVENYYKTFNEKTGKNALKNGFQNFDFSKFKGKRDYPEREHDPECQA